MFANQFNRKTRVKLQVFILKVGHRGPHLTFYQHNAITRDGFNIWLKVPWAPHSEKTFFRPHLYLAEKYCKNLKVPGAQLNVNPAREITWFVGITIYSTFFNNNSPPPRQFLCNKILLENLVTVRGMLVEQIFELRGPGPWPPKQQGLTNGFEKGNDIIASSLSGENLFAC